MMWLTALAQGLIADLAVLTMHMTALLLLVGLASLAVRRASAASRHLLWTVALVTCLILPALRAVVPERSLPSVPAPQAWLAAPAGNPRSTVPVTTPGPLVPETDASGADHAAASPASGAPATPDLATVLLLAWAAGSLVLLVRLIRGAVSLTALAAAAAPVDDPDWRRDAAASAAAAGLSDDSVRIRRSDAEHAPMAWGLGRPTILLPARSAQWSAERRRQVLQHEIAHLARRDCITQLLAGIACAVYWFHPLVWWAARRMVVERERACDDHVIMSGAEPAGYAQHLLQVARGLQHRSAGASLGVAMARRAELSGRLLAILDTGRDRRAPGPLSIAAVAIGVVVLASGLGSLTPDGRPDTARAAAVRTETPRTAGQTWTMERIRGRIDEANRAIEKAVRDKDLDAMVAPYSADMTLLAMNGAEGHGLGDLRIAFQHMLDTYRGLDIETLEVERVRHDIVYEIGRYRYHHGTEPASLQGRYLSVWRLEQGQWFIYRDISNF